MDGDEAALGKVDIGDRDAVARQLRSVTVTDGDAAYAAPAMQLLPPSRWQVR
jgi:hypothetical protein